MYGPGERASAMAVQQLGLAAGAAAANLLGGLLVDRLGWRGVFGVMGVPGFVLAGLLLLTLEDPPTAGLGKYGDARAVGASGDRSFRGQIGGGARGAGARRAGAATRATSSSSRAATKETDPPGVLGRA